MDKLKECIELELRKYLWLSHGHFGLYGDDGEMQCGKCGLADYKRDPLNDLIKKAIKAREETDLQSLIDKDGICYYCGKKTNSLAGNPSEWAVFLCHRDEPGKSKPHHTGCVMERLEPSKDVISKVRGILVHLYVKGLQSKKAGSTTKMNRIVNQTITALTPYLKGRK